MWKYSISIHYHQIDKPKTKHHRFNMTHLHSERATLLSVTADCSVRYTPKFTRLIRKQLQIYCTPINNSNVILIYKTWLATNSSWIVQYHNKNSTFQYACNVSLNYDYTALIKAIIGGMDNIYCGVRLA